MIMVLSPLMEKEVSFTQGEVCADDLSKKLISISESPEVFPVRSRDVLIKKDSPNQVVEAREKSAYVASITQSVFRLFNNAGLPVACELSDDNRQMIPLKCVVRRFAAGTYRARFPDIMEGTRFARPLVEFFLKTDGGRVHYQSGETSGFLAMDPLCEDMPMENPWIHNPFGKTWSLRHPESIGDAQGNGKRLKPSLVLPPAPGLIAELEMLSRRAFLVIEKSWAALGYQLIDFELEFGIDAYGVVCIAGDVNPDSWHLNDDRRARESKELFREGSTWRELKPRYHTVADLVSRFPGVKPGELMAMDAG